LAFFAPDNLDPLALLIHEIYRFPGSFDRLAVVWEGHGLPVRPEFDAYHYYDLLNLLVKSMPAARA
jgi:hypothetical protein